MSLATSNFALPLRAPMATARGELRARRGVFVRAFLRDGRMGLGEAAPLPPWTEDLKACGAALAAATEQLEGPLEDPEEALSDLDAFCRPLRHAPAARAGLALALLDLAAQEAGEPLAAYLARTRLQRGVDPGPVPANAVVGAASPKEAAAAAERAVADGFGCVKLKLSGRDDAARAAAVRAAVGDAVELRLDANGAWPADEAESRLRALARWAPSYVEQPVPAEDVEALRRLRHARIVPVAADEAASSLPAAMRVLEQDACDVLVVKPGALGGPDRAAELLKACEARGVRAVVTTLLDGPVATAGALHVAALLRAPRPACGLATLDLFGPPPPWPRVVRGSLALPSGPGLGRGP